jgi:hypothetical protein
MQTADSPIGKDDRIELMEKTTQKLRRLCGYVLSFFAE